MSDDTDISRVSELIAEADALFPKTARPDHFTDFRHCCECAEHDETLREHTRDSIGLKQLGSPAWDPIDFTTAEGFLYYFPALVRLALTSDGDSYYVDQFLSHLICDGPANRRWQAFSRPERRLVKNVLDALLETKVDEIEAAMDADRLIEAIEIWSR